MAENGTHTASCRQAPVLALLDASHREARAALRGTERKAVDAVCWCAAHLAAVDRALYTVAQRRLRDGRRMVRAQRAADHRLQNVLWQLDRRLTGDVQLAGLSLGALEEAFHAALDQHEAGEQALVERLGWVLAEEEQRDLVQALERAMEHAPRRPHPDTPHGRLISGPTFWLDARADQLRDVMDGRSDPVPHAEPPPRRTPGRWASYLMARPYAGASPARRSGDGDQRS